MDKIIKESFIYKIIISISNWLNKICSNSLLVNIFLTETKAEREKIYKKAKLYKQNRRLRNLRFDFFFYLFYGIINHF